jgi:hypothetical protein
MFSSDQYPSLHLAIPAFELIHNKWKQRRDDTKDVALQPFKPALKQGITTISKYYQLTADTHAHIICCGVYIFSFLIHILFMTILQLLIHRKRWDVLVNGLLQNVQKSLPLHEER